jgi:4-hydroxy-L-threonine phosphate dehydrogenase PdxA
MYKIRRICATNVAMEKLQGLRILSVLACVCVCVAYVTRHVTRMRRILSPATRLALTICFHIIQKKIKRFSFRAQFSEAS